LLGGVVAAVAQAVGGATSLGGGIVLGSAFVVHAIVIALFSRAENAAAGIFSATTAVAAMLTFALAAYAVLGDPRIAAAGAGAAAGVLAPARGAARLGAQAHLAGIAVGTGAAGHVLHRTADPARRTGRAVRRRESAGGLDHRHRARRRLLPRLCRGE